NHSSGARTGEIATRQSPENPGAAAQRAGRVRWYLSAVCCGAPTRWLFANLGKDVLPRANGLRTCGNDPLLPRYKVQEICSGPKGLSYFPKHLDMRAAPVRSIFSKLRSSPKIARLALES